MYYMNRNTDIIQLLDKAVLKMRRKILKIISMLKRNALSVSLALSLIIYSTVSLALALSLIIYSTPFSQVGMSAQIPELEIYSYVLLFPSSFGTFVKW